MQYQPGPQQQVIMARPLTIEDLKQNWEITSTRRKLLILLSIVLVLVAFDLIGKMVPTKPVDTRSNEDVEHKSTTIFVGSIFTVGIELINDIIFLIVVIKYHRMGILICTWASLICLILNLVSTLASLPGAIELVYEKHGKRNTTIAAIFISIALVGCASILTIVIVVFAFKLAKLIKNLKASGMV